MTPRMTGLQAFALSLLGLLSTRRSAILQRDEYEALLNILAARLARDLLRETDEEIEAA